MPIKSTHKIPIPQVSLPTYIFGSPTASLPQTPFYISTTHPETHTLSLTTYRLYAQRLAHGLRAAGLQRGDRVLIFSGNTLFLPSVVMGVIMAGGVFTGANPSYVARELAYQLEDSGARFMLCAEGSLETGVRAAEEVGMGAESVYVFDDGVATFEGKNKGAETRIGALKAWTDLLGNEEEGRRFAWDELEGDGLDELVALNYSSGTTGKAKGVMISHRNYVANSAQQLHMQAQDPQYEEKLKRKRCLCFLPLYHAMAQALFAVNAPKLGIPVYMLPRFDLAAMLDAIARFRITDLTLVPPIVVAMAKHPAVRAADLSSVESVSSGAAPLGREVSAEFERLWADGRVNVKQGWGMTELTCAATTFSPAKRSESFSVGELLANCEAKIVLDEEGKVEAKQGERGEVWVRAPNVMRGYWKKPEATREVLTQDGWLKTGDVAYVDTEGHFFIVDRKKELIKVKGLQVAPAELEALLLDHPHVQDAAVIGVPHNNDEAPRAYIVAQPAEKAGPALAADIQSWLAERVSRHKRLEGGVRFMSAVPKNPSGKILRKVLREQALQEDTKAKL